MFTTNDNNNRTPISSDINNHAFTGFYSYSTLLEAQMLKPRSFLCYELQAATEEDDDQEAMKNLEVFLKFVQKGFENLNQQYSYMFEEDDDGASWILKQFETLILLFKWAKKCTCVQDYIDWSCTAYKMITGKSYTKAINRLFVSILTPTTQSGGFGETLFTLRKAFDLYEAATDNPLVKRLTGVYSHMLVQGFLERFGLVIDDESYSKMEQKALKAQFSSRKTMLMCILETTLFICERAYEWKRTGDVSVFLNNGGAYNAWMKEADEVLALAPFTGNLEPHGTNYFKFTSQVSDLIERGQAYAKFTQNISAGEVMFIKKRLYGLQLLKNTEITKKSSQKERRAPFGVLIHGTSSVAKSTFTKMLYYYYGAVFGLDNDDHYRYVRSPTDEYWTNFDSSKWCIQMDDIAFLLPSKSSEVDPTLKEMLNVVNNVPYVPTQAALEDKGKTPVLAKLVLATTNAPHLNANDYFYCPLAVRRRLPYVIHIEPKDQYLHENRRFIDPSRLPAITDKYPDYWKITVQKIVPVKEGQRDRAALVDVKTYTDVRDFLADFARNAKYHELIQDKAMACDSTMKNFGICRTCFYQECQCVNLQSMDVTETDTAMWQVQTTTDVVQAWLAIRMAILLTWFCSLAITSRLMIFAGETRIGRYIVSKHILPYASDRIQAKIFGRWAQALQGPMKWRVAVALFAGVTSLVGVYLMTQKPKKITEKSDTSKDDEVVKDTFTGNYQWDEPEKNAQTMEKIVDCLSCYTKADFDAYNQRVGNKNVPLKVEVQDGFYTIQGNVHGTTETQLEKEERTNVWYQPTLELTTFDVPVASRSLMVRDKDQIREYFGKNCVRLKVVSIIGGRRIARWNGGVYLRGQLVLTNGHTFREGESVYEVTIITSSTAQGLNGNITFVLMRKDITFNAAKDMAVFDVRSLPPRKDILPFWGHATGDAYKKLVSLRRNDAGLMEALEVFNVCLNPKMPIGDLGIEVDILTGTQLEETKVGDCGSLALAATPRGTIVAGLHVVGHGTKAGFLHITRQDIDDIMSKHHEFHDDYSLISGEGEPMLSIQDKTNVLTVPHHRSLFRYLEEGNIHIYGSFAGFRPRPRSKVCNTPLQAEMMEHFGMTIEHDKPCMNGWEPWRNNVVHMVKPTVNYRRDVLDHCVDAYFDDVVAGLPQDWEKELVFLSKEASLNGLPGVRFIDAINKNSSMGFPWGHSKKQHLTPKPTEKYPEGVDMDAEVWERYDTICEKYAEGKRAFPVYTGHLKDEPTLLRKVQAKKTRVFTGAPIDWSLVVRSRLLSFVRLMQKNKFIFEAGVGTVCQSKEWGDVFEYLTHFGLGQMVAGDFSAYDKRMIADFILAAFRFIARIHSKAGFSALECREIMAIGYDVAFSVVNFNGDLVEFFGTNPSGHALTVVINSIVNSLYMRYAYTMLNPEHVATTFKDHVRLFTYGDDNVQGVNMAAPWYNHTAIQQELERIGVVYTMADKDSETVPYIHIDEVSFLKRSWKYNEEVNGWLCPLDEASIHKSLTKWLPSGTIDAQAQMVAVISSANSEYFFYGREVFEKHHKFFRSILNIPAYSIYESAGTLPNWEQLVDRFHRAA